MGIAIRIADVTFTKYIGTVDIEDDPIIPDEPTIPTTYPVTDTLKGLYYLGGTLEDSLVNHAEGGTTATAKEGVTVSDGNAYATFTGDEMAARIDTGVTTSVDNPTTLVALFRVPTGLRFIVSNRLYSGAHISLSNRAAHYYAGSNLDTQFDGGLINSDTNFVLLAMTADANGARVVKDNNGELVELANYSGAIDAWTKPFYIGGCNARFSYNSTADIALVSIHEGEMTDAQLQQIFAYVRYYGESKGLTIE